MEENAKKQEEATKTENQSSANVKAEESKGLFGINWKKVGMRVLYIAAGVGAGYACEQLGEKIGEKNTLRAHQEDFELADRQREYERRVMERNNNR